MEVTVFHRIEFDRGRWERSSVPGGVEYTPKSDGAGYRVYGSNPQRPAEKVEKKLDAGGSIIVSGNAAHVHAP